MEAVCLWCGKPATHFCDAVIGVEAKAAIRDKNGQIETLLGGLDGAVWTCDAPMCADHAVSVGHMHCRSGVQVETIDHCPLHVQSGEEEFRDIVMFEDEAKSKRANLHAQIRRSQISLAGIKVG